MAKKNDDFFKEKKPWSEVKDELLGCYLKPYIQKVLHTRKPIVYVDCFAGKGVFEDGKPGSPLIALGTIQECSGATTMQNCDIRPYFIDLNYAEELQQNLHNYSVSAVVAGRYHEQIEHILSTASNCNVFLYIDPYGIKALNYALFKKFASERRFNSIELLINLNSFGFIREGCRALGVYFKDDAIFEDLVEYDSTRLDAGDKSITELNEIAGGDYWQVIIHSFKEGEISGYRAEELFAEQYCENLRSSYGYVLNMPLRIQQGQRPKYRMIHATNHVDGCLLMVDNIYNRWQVMKDIQTGGQVSLFDEDCNNREIDKSAIAQQVEDLCRNLNDFKRVNVALAQFYMKYGPICSTGEIKKVLKQLESEGKVDVVRTPPYTSTGKLSAFFSDEKSKTVSIRWRA